MIPAVSGAAAVGALLLMLASLVGLGLLAWWGWRLWHAYRGRPRRPLRVWQWIAAVVLSVLPIFTAVSLAGIAWQDYRLERQRAEEDRLRHVTLTGPAAWGDITLPAGSHVERDMPDGGVERADGRPDLRGLREVRFPRPVRVGELWVNAMSVSGQVVLELARPHRFAAHGGQPAEDCEAGHMAQFNARQPSLGEPFPPRLDGLAMADWVFDTCFQSDSGVMLRYWKNGELVWAEAPGGGKE